MNSIRNVQSRVNILIKLTWTNSSFLGIGTTRCRNVKHLRDHSSVRAFSAGSVRYEAFSQIRRALEYGDKDAIYDQNGKYTYNTLAKLSLQVAGGLKRQVSLQGERVAFITPNDASYVVSMWSAWLSGATCVPICKSHPASEIDYVLQDSKPKVVISTPEYSEMIETLARKREILHYPIPSDISQIKVNSDNNLDDFSSHNEALIIYTSGTTGRPKGAIWSHTNLNLQIDRMLHCWRWSQNDAILHLLPLHHIHGSVNALMCPLVIGGTIVMRNKFNPQEVWNLLLGKLSEFPRISVFMAVPTIYMKLLQYYDQCLIDRSVEVLERCKEIRLMVSGSASLPQPVFNRWKSLTSHDLLERYGMTETGMVLTNPYHGPRIPGAVGKPFSGVKVKIVSEDDPTRIIVQATSEIVEETRGLEGHQGELLVQGLIFQEYLNKPEATKDSFTEDGWFKTGDTASYKDGTFRIVGRTSVDIIKSGGYKIGALDVERHLLEHENIQEVAVLGIPDDTWGQRVAALAVLKNPEDELTLEGLKSWCSKRMVPYHIPTRLKVTTEIPKNAMGKINKKELVKIFMD